MTLVINGFEKVKRLLTGFKDFFLFFASGYFGLSSPCVRDPALKAGNGSAVAPRAPKSLRLHMGAPLQQRTGGGAPGAEEWEDPLPVRRNVRWLFIFLLYSFSPVQRGRAFFYFLSLCNIKTRASADVSVLVCFVFVLSFHQMNSV